MKRILFLLSLLIGFPLFTLMGQTISSLFPDSTHQGQTVNVTITGTGVNFMSGTGASLVRLTGPGNIQSSSVTVQSATQLTAQFNISPVANPGIYNVQVYSYTNTLLGAFEITGIPPSQQIFQVTGKVYHDNNNNCIYDAGDLPVVNRVVRVGNSYVSTGSQGDYSCFKNLGSYNVTIPTISPYERLLCVTQIPVSSGTNGEVLAGNDFPLDTIQYREIWVGLSNPVLRPGFTVIQSLQIDNLGSVPYYNVIVHHRTDPVLTRKSTSGAFSIAADTTTWVIPVILPQQYLTFSITDSVSAAAPLGTPTSKKAWVELSPVDNNPNNNIKIVSRPLQGSFDPNDKRVFDLAENPVDRFVPEGDSILHYYIRFQNTGNDTAFNIFVRDTLDPNLDIQSIQTLIASHNYLMTVQDRAIQWYFPNIHLLDSFSNEPASHGFIEFEIKYNPSLPAGTSFQNKASIYFDYNAPVVTNETETIICNPVTGSYTSTVSGLNASFTGSAASATTWFWDFGDGATSTQQNPSHIYANSGTYTVCMVATNSCGRDDTTCQSITVTCPTISPAFSFSTTNLSATFTNTTPSGTTGFHWNFGDGNTSTVANPSHAYSAPGTYIVCLIAMSACGNDTTCQTVTVTCVAPSSAFGFSAGTVGWDFTDQSTNSPSNWFWDFGDGSTSMIQNPTNHLFPQAGTYTVCLIASNGCGADTSCQTLIITAMTNPDLAQFEIFPNPTLGNFKISGSANGLIRIELVDITGRTVLPIKYIHTGGSFTETFEAQTLPAGMYFLQVGTESHVEQFKVVKQ